MQIITQHQPWSHVLIGWIHLALPILLPTTGRTEGKIVSAPTSVTNQGPEVSFDCLWTMYCSEWVIQNRGTKKNFGSFSKRIKFSVFTQLPLFAGNVTVNENLIFSLKRITVIGLIGQNTVLCVAYLKMHEIILIIFHLVWFFVS